MEIEGFETASAEWFRVGHSLSKVLKNRESEECTAWSMGKVPQANSIFLSFRQKLKSCLLSGTRNFETRLSQMKGVAILEESDRQQLEGQSELEQFVLTKYHG